MKPPHKPTFAWLCIIPPALILFFLCACGYNLVGRSSFLPEHIHNIAIPPFQNNTTQYRLGQELTAQVMEEFQRRGKYEIQPKEEPDSHALLEGEILSFNSKPLTFDANGRVNQFVVFLNVRIRFTDLTTGEEIYYNDLFSFKQNYQISVDSADFFDQESVAIRLSAKDFARTLVTTILEGF